MTEYNDKVIVSSEVLPGDIVLELGAFVAGEDVSAIVQRVVTTTLDGKTKIVFQGDSQVILDDDWLIRVNRPKTKDERALYIFKNHDNREASVQLSGNLYNNATRIVGIGKDNLGIVYKSD